MCSIFGIKKAGAVSGFFFQNLFSACLMSGQYGANHDGLKLDKLYEEFKYFSNFYFSLLSMIM